MRWLINVWCGLSPRFRCLIWGGWTFGWCGVAVAAACAMASPQDVLRQPRTATDAQWRMLYRLKSSVDEGIILDEAKTPAFSPLGLQVENARLLHWQPATQGGELALRASWEAVPVVFMTLAGQGVAVSRFSLSREEAGLLLTLQLEPLHDG